MIYRVFGVTLDDIQGVGVMIYRVFTVVMIYKVFGVMMIYRVFVVMIYRVFPVMMICRVLVVMIYSVFTVMMIIYRMFVVMIYRVFIVMVIYRVFGVTLDDDEDDREGYHVAADDDNESLGDNSDNPSNLFTSATGQYCTLWLFLNCTPCGLRGCKNSAHSVS